MRALFVHIAAFVLFDSFVRRCRSFRANKPLICKDQMSEDRSLFGGFRAMPFRQDRWPQLRSALRQPVNHVVLVNPFLPSSRREVGDLSSAFRHDIQLFVDNYSKLIRLSCKEPFFELPVCQGFALAIRTFANFVAFSPMKGFRWCLHLWTDRRMVILKRSLSCFVIWVAGGRCQPVLAYLSTG